MMNRLNRALLVTAAMMGIAGLSANDAYAAGEGDYDGEGNPICSPCVSSGFLGFYVHKFPNASCCGSGGDCYKAGSLFHTDNQDGTCEEDSDGHSNHRLCGYA